MTDVAVVGAGPAGLAAATEAARLGLDTLLLDEQSAPGGQVYRNAEHMAPETAAILGEEYRRGAELSSAFRASSARYAPGSTVWHVGPDGTLGVLDATGARLISARRIILAPGAMERPVAIPGWTLPGVMGAGAVQTILKASGQVPDVPVVIAGSGPLVWLVACQLARAGVAISALLVTTPAQRIGSALRHLPRAMQAGGELLKGLRWMQEVRSRGVRIVAGVTGLRVDGDGRAESVACGTERIPAQLVLLHEGVIPRIHLSLAAGCRHVWDAAQLCWKAETDAWGATNQERIAVAGDAGGIVGAGAAENLGWLAALDAACRLSRITPAERDEAAAPERAALRRAAAVRPLLDQLFRPSAEALTPVDDATIVCRCEEVTVRALKDAVAQGATDPNRAKLLTRCGMGPCQGRMCGPGVAAVIAREQNLPVEAVGTWRIRFPVRPLPLTALAALAGGLEAEPEE
jgi:NADPH-dependent 2,4-dienoyl-CoA reductase/sulfur reductase-like enzyme